MAKKYRLLMLTNLIISGCSMCEELIISAVSSYLVGDTVLQYSVTIGLYMCSMGLGSYLSKYIRKELFNKFVWVEIGVGVLGGICAPVLFLANLYLERYELVMYIWIILIGTFVGIEIPLLTRIIENDRENLRVTISSIFSFDYIGGLAGSIAFPLLLLPHLGYYATSFLTGSMNIFAAGIIVFRHHRRITKPLFFKTLVCVLFGLLISGAAFSDNLSNYVENGLYRDRVILSKHTQYQHIVMTKHRDDLRLFINGNIQFCSQDEYRYHEALVHMPMSRAESKEEVLVLGGGDGLAVRELLKYEGTNITLVDLDREMVDICRENPNIKELNGGALDSERLTVVIDDAYRYLEETDKLFDVILVDLPDPNDQSLNKLYTNIFYRLCGNHLTEKGIMAVQSTSPYYAKEAFWCINKTIESEGFNVLPYHLQVPSFGDWGFNMASRNELSKDCEITVPTKYLTSENSLGMFIFGKDETADNVQINSLARPMLLEYYMEAVKNWE